MSHYLFVLGRTPELAYGELCSFFPKVTYISTHLSIVEVSDQSLLLSAFQKLGGSIKVARIIDRTNELSPQLLTSYLTDETSQKITFGISGYDGAFSPSTPFLHDMKKMLEDKGMSCRFVSPKKGDTLSSVVITGQHVVELIVGKENGRYMIGKTISVQDFGDWNKRDYGRPQVDPKAGMLPPKVARMIVNIANSSPGRSSSATFRGASFDSWKVKRVLLDPFCGMGTILAEALLTGWNVVGADQSADATSRTKKNLEWLARQYSEVDGSNIQLFISDATHISSHIPKASIDAIVTEPFMGSARKIGNNPINQLSNKQIIEIKNTIKGLEKLYIGCLRDWYRLLKHNGKVVIALPSYNVQGREFFVKKVIDMCENLGYTVEQGPIEYSRPQAVVRRKFYILRKK
ncbi:hypothetical protein HY409_03465 [Candidatus Gottesmanbacteria bacterium]|nr:hypothetical protein [Candidatus Gottesmanbacteria bacterium]